MFVTHLLYFYRYTESRLACSCNISYSRTLFQCSLEVGFCGFNSSRTTNPNNLGTFRDIKADLLSLFYYSPPFHSFVIFINRQPREAGSHCDCIKLIAGGLEASGSDHAF